MANYANTQNFGNPLDPDWQKRNLVPVTSPNGQTWNVHKDAASSFENLLKDLHDAGYIPTSSGGFNYRNIRGTNKLSQHAFGNAIDINAATNPQGSAKTDLPPNTAELAAKHGLEWGGLWKNKPDPMHFEWKGPQDQPQPQPNANTAVASATPVVNTGMLASGQPQGNLPTFAQPAVQQQTAALQAPKPQGDPTQWTGGQYAGLLSSGLSAMAAGAPRQTWTPMAWTPYRRPEQFAGFTGLLG